MQEHAPNAPSPDVIVVGAGPAGLALACALDDAGLSSLVLEQQGAATLAAPPEDGRDIALTHRARAILQGLGLWARLPNEAVAPLQEARVEDAGSADVLRFATSADRHAPAGAPLGWLVPNHLIRQAAHDEARARPRVQIVAGAKVTALAMAGPAAEATLADGRRFSAPLVVAADSRFSETRRRAGIGAALRDFGRTVVVGRVAHDQPHHGVAWECFRYGNTLALLPMNGGLSSAVVTVASDKAPEWLGLSDDAFAQRIQAQAGPRLGAVRPAGPRHAYPLVGAYAQRFVAPRFALLGDAAVGMHPVTAHGYNFGLYGVQVLARELAAARRRGADLGALATLAPYETEHRRSTWPIYHGTNAVVQLFTDERAPARWLRRAVLAASERVPPVAALVHRAVTRQLTAAG